MAHQAASADFAGSKPGAGFILERGCGKTAAALTNANDLIKAGLVNRALYIAPLSTLENVRRTCFTFRACLGLQPTILGGEKKKRIQLIKAARGNLDIINFEGARTVQDDLLAAKYDLVIVDESIRIADYNTQVSEVVRLLGRQAKFRRIATGSPFTEGLEDAWNQIEFLAPGLLGQSGFFGFRNRYCELDKKEIPDRDKAGKMIMIEDGLCCSMCKQTVTSQKPCDFCGGKIIPKKTPKMRTYQVISGYKNVDEFTSKIAPYLFFARKKDVLPNLPDKTYEVLEVEMGEKQRKVYQTIHDQLASELEDGTVIDHSSVLSKVQKLRQVASGFLYGEDREPHFIPSHKFEALTGAMKDGLYGTKKMVIFTSFRAEPSMLEDCIGGMSKKIAVYHLPEKPEDRQPAIDHWSAFKNSPAVMIANVRSGGVGLNMMAADWACFFSNDWRLDDREQAEDRIHRKGSEIHQKISITDILTIDTIEVQILKSLREKRGLVEVVLEDLRRKQKEAK